MTATVSRWVIMITAPILGILLGQPLVYIAAHGLHPTLWEAATGTPYEWFIAVLGGNFPKSVRYLASLPPFYFLPGWVLIAAGTIWCIVVAYLDTPYVPPRIADGKQGNADWASAAELAAMRLGLEIGKAPTTGKPVRIATNSNLMTIEPPRRGKTDGFVLPNLAVPDPDAWSGPVVVIDPKGDVYRATRRRRAELGRRVVYLDLTGGAEGTDAFNVLDKLKKSDVSKMLAIARRLLPSAKSDSANGGYFINRAVDFIAGAIHVSLGFNKATLYDVAEWCDCPDILEEYLAKDGASVARRALKILRMDLKNREPITSTADLAFQALADSRFRSVFEKSTFDLEDLCRDKLDLFIGIPDEEVAQATAAPYVRLLLSAVFETIRRSNRKRRIVMFIDEAASLGRFDELPKACAVMPGLGLSIWTFWQSKSQIAEQYGAEGAKTMLDTASVITVSGVSAANIDEKEQWSAALGSYTEMETTTTTDAAGKAQITRAASERKLAPPSDVPAVTQLRQIVFINHRDLTTRPLLIDKTIAYTDRRFEGLVDFIKPTAAT